MAEVVAPSQEHKSSVEDHSTKASLDKQEMHVLPTYSTEPGKTKQVGPTKSETLQSSKRYPVQ